MKSVCRGLNLERDNHAVLEAIGELHGHVLIALACEIKTYEIYSLGFLARYAKICTNKNFPLYGMPPSAVH